MDSIPPPEPQADRTVRHLGMLKKLAELGMQLAERAAEDALREPDSAEPRRRGPDPALVFTRLARTVRDAIALEARLAAAHAPSPTHARREAPADPRRHAISAFLHDALEESPEPKQVRAGLHDQIETLIDAYLAEDTAMEHAGGQIVLAICQELNIPYDLARMPDELLLPHGQKLPGKHEEYTAGRNATA